MLLEKNNMICPSKIEVAHALSNGAIFSYFELRVSKISRENTWSTLHVSEMVRNRRMVKRNTNRNLYTPNGVITSDKGGGKSFCPCLSVCLRRHLVNAYEVKAGVGVVADKTV